MKRLSYRKDNDTYISNLVPLFSDMVYALIFQDFSFEIRTLKNNGEVCTISHGQGKDLRDSKVRVRKQLESIGVVFKDELRNRA